MKIIRKSLTVLLLVITVSVFSQETVAILPFGFTDNGHVSVQEGKEAQQFLINYIIKKQKHFKVKPLNARDVNVALNKAGITPETLDNYTIQEISEVVRADYILLGTIDKALQGTSTTAGGYESANVKDDYSGTNSYGVASSSTTSQYHATVYISIFKSDGTSLYDQNKGNVFIDTAPDSWKNSILWMVRHFPFYK
ncbi:MAG: hypothetical protein DRI88_08400 [Bacteroidetes bacterium]|nr:MAG: hypothetical protein DRI88_08400 [Bacteroidota bacterium]RLD88945.1 MAG: hypothetical protein DRJ02_02810 [Bacteroidota bacterium]